MKSLRVNLKERSYQIHLGPIEKGFVSALRARCASSPCKTFLITSKSVEAAGHLSKVRGLLAKNGFQPTVAVLPDGESRKNLNTLARLLSVGARMGLDRRSLVVAMGGGVITDLAGFFSSVYMRGVDYVSVPTTLLGMVDAAIGGKTGVDLPEGKNLAGTFWQPRLVWLDQYFLKTLPLRQWKTGFAEILKYGVIKDSRFFAWLEKETERCPSIKEWSTQNVSKALWRSAQLKAAVVGGDERETPLAGGREILNFGHTGGHALEAAFQYRGLTHGEAISIGMNLAGTMALSHGLWDAESHRRMLHVLSRVGLPVQAPRLTARQKSIFWKALAKDKKHIGGRLRFVLPTQLGRVVVKSDIDVAAVRRALQQITH